MKGILRFTNFIIAIVAVHMPHNGGASNYSELKEARSIAPKEGDCDMSVKAYFPVQIATEESGVRFRVCVQNMSKQEVTYVSDGSRKGVMLLEETERGLEFVEERSVNGSRTEILSIKPGQTLCLKLEVERDVVIEALKRGSLVLGLAIRSPGSQEWCSVYTKPIGLPIEGRDFFNATTEQLIDLDINKAEGAVGEQ